MQQKKTLFTKYLLYLFVLIPLLATGCKKDLTDTIDITSFDWELKSITTNGETKKKPNKDFHNPEAYILIFKNDSTFQLSTSNNLARGQYNISEKGKITITNYGTVTLVAETDFGLQLIEIFNKVTTYEVLGKTLVVKGSKGEVEFKKE